MASRLNGRDVPRSVTVHGECRQTNRVLCAGLCSNDRPQPPTATAVGAAPGSVDTPAPNGAKVRHCVTNWFGGGVLG